jgi:hypothetical protein
VPEPEPFPGWRALREGALVYLREGDPQSAAAAFLECCPAVEGSFEPGSLDMTFVFLCSRQDYEAVREWGRLRQELEDALISVIEVAPMHARLHPRQVRHLGGTRGMPPGQRSGAAFRWRADVMLGGPLYQGIKTAATAHGDAAGR